MKNSYVRQFPRAILIGLGIFCVIVLIQFLNGENVNFDSNLKLTFIYTLLYTVSLHLTNTFLFIKLDQFFKEDRFSKKRIFVGFVASFFLSIFVIFLLRIAEDVIVNKNSFQSFLVNEQASNYILSSIFTFVVLLIIHFVYLYKWYQENRVKEQKIIAGTANAKFESLKNQIDPHFLFNSLNVLSSLIEENPDAAQKFTTSLSKVYRYVLEQKDKELVTVKEELNFAKTYMNLLKMRFENSINFDIKEIQNLDAKVVPLSLQLVLENCIKHNSASEEKPLKIKIYEENNLLVIENNLQKKAILGDRKGVGLQNIVSRYALISKRNVLIEQNEIFFKIKIPILSKQVSLVETQFIANKITSYENAKKRVEKLKGFYSNLISYCVVIPVLIIININTSRYYWFWFPLLGWGSGLLFHGLETFGIVKNWEEEKIQNILNKNKNNQQKWN